MKTVFLDTVGLLAVWDVADQWHTVAVPVFHSLRAAKVRFVTTPLILYECGNAAARRPYRKHVFVMRQLLLIAGDLIEPTVDDIESAWMAYERGNTGHSGIVDQISFAVMRRCGITQAFTNDKHFTAAGFLVLF